MKTYCSAPVFSLRVSLLVLVLSFSVFADAGVIRRGSTRTATTSGNLLQLRKPSGVIAGDVMLVNLAYSGTSGASLTGWTVISQRSLGTGKYGAVLYRIAGRNEPKSYTFYMGADATNAVGAIMAFAGVDISQGHPFDVLPGSINLSATSTATAPSVTTVSNGAAVVMLTQEVGSGRTWSGWNMANLGALTEIADVRKPGDASVGTAWQIATSAGATGVATATLSGAQQNGALVITLKPGATNYFVRTDVAGAANNLQNLASWTDNETGIGGASPPNFSNADQVFNIGFTVTGNHTISGNWTVTGTGSKIVVGDGEVASSFTINNPYSVAGTIDVEQEASLIIATTAPQPALVLGNLELNSTVSYTATSGSQMVKAANYYNLTLTGNALKNAEGDITVDGQLFLGDNPSMERGQLEMTISYTHYADVNDVNSTSIYNNLNSYVLTMGPDATTAGTGDVTGKIRRTTIVSGTTYTFGNANTQLTFNNAGGGELPSLIMVVATLGTQGLHVDKADAVKRLYQVLRTGGTNPTRMIIRLAYRDNELNNNQEPNLVLWDHHLPYGGITPHEHGKTNQSASANWVELSNHFVEYLSSLGSVSFTKYWMISNKISSSIIWLGASSSAWDNPSNWNTGIVPSATDAVVIPDAATTPLDPQLAGTITVGAIEIQPGGILNGGSAILTLTRGPAYNGGAGTWVNNGTFNAGTSTIVINFDSATIAGNTAFYNVTINAGKRAVIQSGATIEIVNSLTNNGVLDATYGKSTIIYSGSSQNIINPNGEVPGYHNLVITGTGAKLPATLQLAGNFTNYGSIDALTNSSTVIFHKTPQSVRQTISGISNFTFYNMQVDNTCGVELTGVNMTVNNQLQLQNGSFILNGGSLAIAGTLTRSAGTIDAGNGTVTFTGTAAQTIPAGSFDGAVQNFVLDKASNELQLNGNLIVNQVSFTNGTFNLLGNTLIIQGIINRQNGVINASAGDMVLNGTDCQPLPAGLLAAKGHVLSVSNPVGISIQAPMSFDEITLEEGPLHLGNYDLTVSSVTGGSPTAFISTNGTGTLKVTISNGAAVTFPVGIASFTPVTITNQSGQADQFDVRVTEEVLDNGPTGVPLSDSYARVKRTWMIQKANPNGGAGVQLLFRWNAADVNGDLKAPRLFHYETSLGRWVKQTGTFSSPDATSFLFTGYTGTFSPFSIIDEQFVLPVQWVSFTARKENDAVLLNWETASECNALDFAVQHSTDGRRWNTLGSRPATGSVGNSASYTYFHANPVSGKNFYRIAQRDADGTIAYSKIEQVYFAAASEIKVFGNPVVNGQLLVQLPFNAQVVIYSNDGKVMYQNRFAAGTHAIPVQSFAKGMYHIKAGTQQVRFIVQ
jgi:hypothetical protein